MWWKEQNRFLLDVGEGGGGAAVLDAPETGVAEPEAGGEEGIEETVEEETPGEGEAGAAEAEETDTGEEAQPAGTSVKSEKTVPLGSLVEVRRQNAELKQRLEAMDARLGEVSATVDKNRPPEKDALENWYEGLPDGNLESDKPQEKEAAELKQDAGLLLRVMKHPEFRKALFAPVLPMMQAMFRSLDLNSWQNEQAMEALSSIVRDKELSARLGDKIPAGVKHRERILKHHQDMVTKSGGRWVPVREAADAFGKIQAQADAETKSAVGAAAEAATERTLKEVSQRRTATGGLRSESPVPRGGLGKTGKRTPEQIENAAGDFRIP